MTDVTHDGDVQAGQDERPGGAAAEALLTFPADREAVEQGLRRVFVGAVTGICYDRLILGLPGASSQRATCTGTPAQAWRTTKASTPMASIVSTVSRRDSPLLSELEEL